VLAVVLKRTLDPLDEARIHLDQPLARIFADDLVAGLPRRVPAAVIRSRLTNSFAV
jgi:hypothetical protein